MWRHYTASERGTYFTRLYSLNSLSPAFLCKKVHFLHPSFLPTFGRLLHVIFQRKRRGGGELGLSEVLFDVAENVG